ncbi:redoxin domain-containing protein [Palleronia abyssalis]|uniref:Thiol-disulfide oxidoreductase ResA n=1 Tax=Palleronia abyssalis TaxID=1501240 RepID=A0A2R8BYF2_9RHOB|nr:redoxin domain-containing protein [Palleronia abyssalis]SPJ25174.1 Thiol-disulfide oxidoreductase ResA [Palleronia abyssalis]
MPTTPMPDQTAPDLDVKLIIGTEWKLKDQSPDAFTQIIVYRGLHCPICKQYLSKMRELYDEFLSKGIETIHVSMDSEERARQAHEDWSLDPIPMGYGLTEEQARDWGLYLSEPIQDSEKGTFAEPAVFWVRPDGRLYLANISSAPFARPDLEALLGRVDMIKEKEYPARGRKAA